MHKFTRLTTLAMFGAMVLGAAGCSNTKYDLELWHNFGAGYTDKFNKALTNPVQSAMGKAIKAQSKGSYDGILESITKTLSTRDFPNIATGYPDHLSTYAKSGYPASPTGVLLNLNDFLDDEALNAEHKEKTKTESNPNGYTFREDYYEEYMVENNTICYDDNDKELTVGVPFNKSTEVLGYNGVFVDYAKYRDASLKIPETWDEMKTLGPKYRAIQMELTGKYLCGDQTAEGTASNFKVVEPANLDPNDKVLLDFTEVNDKETCVFSWDSMANMFITLVRQFGSEFTSYTSEDRHQAQLVDRHGYMEFYSGDRADPNSNASKTVAAMELVRELAGDANKPEERIFTTPKVLGGQYASAAFAQNKVMFTICSTGGLSYNLNEDQRFRVAPIPYKDAEHKYVISQGANMTIFKRNSKDKPDDYNLAEVSKMAFDAVVSMTTGENQAEWAILTGYYPASRSAAESKAYQEFINPSSIDYEDSERVAYIESAQLNANEYMNASKKWIKFVDPGFDGSATIRNRVDGIIGDIVIEAGKTIDEILASYYSALSNYVRK